MAARSSASAGSSAASRTATSAAATLSARSSSKTLRRSREGGGPYARPVEDAPYACVPAFAGRPSRAPNRWTARRASALLKGSEEARPAQPGALGGNGMTGLLKAAVAAVALLWGGAASAQQAIELHGASQF